MAAYSHEAAVGLKAQMLCSDDSICLTGAEALESAARAIDKSVLKKTTAELKLMRKFTREVADAVLGMAEGFIETSNNTKMCDKFAHNETRLTRTFMTFDGPLNPDSSISDFLTPVDNSASCLSALTEHACLNTVFHTRTSQVSAMLPGHNASASRRRRRTTTALPSPNDFYNVVGCLDTSDGSTASIQFNESDAEGQSWASIRAAVEEVNEILKPAAQHLHGVLDPANALAFRKAHCCGSDSSRAEPVTECPTAGITEGVWERIRTVIRPEVKAFGSILVHEPTVQSQRECSNLADRF